jgi:hypothetical protein
LLFGQNIFSGSLLVYSRLPENQSSNFYIPHHAIFLCFSNLKTIATQNRRRLIGTFSLVAAENLLINTYPLFAGFAIN